MEETRRDDLFFDVKVLSIAERHENGRASLMPGGGVRVVEDREVVLEALKNGAHFLGLSFLNEEAVSRAGQAQDVGEDPLLAFEHVARGSVGRQALHVV